MVRMTLPSVALAASVSVAALPAVEIHQTLYGEALIEGVFQNNYTDGTSRSYSRTDPLVYSNLGQISMVNGRDYFSGDLDADGVFRGLVIDPRTYQLLVLDQDRRTYYRDSSSLMWIRAKLGGKIQIEDSVEVHISLVYDAEGGDRSHFGDPGSISGRVSVNDASVRLRRFLLDDLHLHLGRQPVSWNLRRGQGAFLHDSRANNPSVTSWDGLRADYNWGNFTFSPYHFILNAAREERGLDIPGDGLVSGRSGSRDNTLSGLHVDWQPEGPVNSRLLISGAINLERNVLVEEANRLTGRPELVGDKLWNYYLGAEVSFPDGISLWAEGSMQSGRLDSLQDFRGRGVSAGIEWDLQGANNAIIGIQVDHRSGDRNHDDSVYALAFNDESLIGRSLGLSLTDRILLSHINPPSGRNRYYQGFVAPWEGVSDALIVEHERYGELSRLVVGNMNALKAKLEYRFDHLDVRRPFHLKFLYATFVMDQPGFDQVSLQNLAGFFGNEFNLSASWQYNAFTNINLFGGVFLPGLGYRQVAAQAYPNSAFKPDEVRDYQFIDQAINGTPSALSTYYDALYPRLAGSDAITIFGLNVQVVF